MPSYLSVQLAGIPIIVQQPGPFTAPFFDRRMGVFVPSLVGWLRHLPMDWFQNWLAPRMKFWIHPFNQLASELGLPQYKSTLDFVAGDLTLVMDAPEILGISPDELEDYQPRHPQFSRPQRSNKRSRPAIDPDPQQKNGSRCGVHAEALASCLTVDLQGPSTLLRKRLGGVLKPTVHR